MFTEKELKVVGQFLKDNSENKGNEKLQSEQIKEIVNYFKLKKIENGDCLVKMEMSNAGGHMTVYQIEELESYGDWKNYGDYIGFKGQNTTFLIESPEYGSKSIEPYNRQSGFYIPYSFNDLSKEIIEKWNVYSVTHSENIAMPTRDFYYNDFWNDVSFCIAVKSNEILKFINGIMPMFDIMPYEIDKYIESKLNKEIE